MTCTCNSSKEFKTISWPWKKQFIFTFCLIENFNSSHHTVSEHDNALIKCECIIFQKKQNKMRCYNKLYNLLAWWMNSHMWMENYLKTRDTWSILSIITFHSRAQSPFILSLHPISLAATKKNGLITNSTQINMVSYLAFSQSINNNLKNTKLKKEKWQISIMYFEFCFSRSHCQLVRA